MCLDYSHPQIKPLTEEEKKAKLEELRTKLAEKRAMQSKEDVKDQRANEVSPSSSSRFSGIWLTFQQLRRKAGQDQGKIREEMRAKEMAKDVERKRQGG